MVETCNTRNTNANANHCQQDLFGQVVRQSKPRSRPPRPGRSAGGVAVAVSEPPHPKFPQLNLTSAIFNPRTYWESLPSLDEYVERIFCHYRAVGFPFYETDKKTRDAEFGRLMTYEIGGVLRDGVIGQTMHGLALAWSYMPHSWDVRCNGKKTPMEVFCDDVIFRRVIRKRLSMGDNVSDAGIRKMLRMYSGVQAVSNFRPTAAAALYREYCPYGGRVLDMSMGYGGRLLGAIRAGVDYVGYDPCVETFWGLEAIYGDYGDGIRANLYMDGSENMDIGESVDFAFTSPPYFDTERYSDEGTQSWVKYPTRADWLEGFMRRTILRTHRALRPHGRMALNVANVPSFRELETEVVRVATECGFELERTLKLALSNSNFRNKGLKFKYEPVFVFRKRQFF